VNNRLGSGSDYTVFLNHLGVPVADLTFEGPYGVYHSLYDDALWVSRIGDPGFRYHVALVRLWGLVALRLATADALPLDYQPYAERIAEFARELGGPLAPRIEGAAAAFGEAAAAFNRRRDAALEANDRAALDALNRALMRVERAFIDQAGIPGRRWYRHLIYAPKFTYAPDLLPAVTDALAGGRTGDAAREADRLLAALDRAAITLR
jgi:N-acetylated-alpha-linked acidic dipeptidase